MICIPKGNKFSKYCTSLIYAHYYAYSKVHFCVFFGKVMAKLTLIDPQQLRVPVLLGVGFVTGRTAAASTPGAAVLR